VPDRTSAFTRTILAILCLSLTFATAAAQMSPPTSGSVQHPPLLNPTQPGVVSNLLVNGDFENRTRPSGCYDNQSNAQVTADLPGITAFGPADEIDIYADGTPCLYGLPPQSGIVKLAIDHQSNGPQDAFAFSLTTPVVAGTSYDFSCYAAPNRDFGGATGAVDIGLSNNPLDFGTLVWTGTPAAVEVWSHLTQTFIASMNASYLTVRADGPLQSWLHVDNFSLSPTGVVSVRGTRWARLKAIYR